MFPTDASSQPGERLVRLAAQVGVELRQSYARVGKLALIKHQRYAHAHQLKRANRSLRKLKTYLGRVIRDIGRRIDGDPELEEIFAQPLSLSRACWPRINGSADPRSIPSMRRKWSALARARHIGHTSSG